MVPLDPIEPVSNPEETMAVPERPVRDCTCFGGVEDSLITYIEKN